MYIFQLVLSIIQLAQDICTSKSDERSRIGEKRIRFEAIKREPMSENKITRRQVVKKSRHNSPCSLPANLLIVGSVGKIIFQHVSLSTKASGKISFIATCHVV